MDVLRSIPEYRTRFKQIFGSDKINIDMVTDAIAAFEETLVTPDSRFDKWLKGDKSAINQTETGGLQDIQGERVHQLSQRAAVGGASFQKFGIHEPYKTTSKAEGRFAVTGKDADRFMFKVPTLRNVELTYPYFHDGAAATLEEAVNTMGRLQLGRKFRKEENAKIVAFLKTLTGKQPEFKLPILPPSTNETPKPKPFGVWITRRLQLHIFRHAQAGS